MTDARFPRLFIVTYGRSGSTLLQGVLNAIPGYHIKGENDALVNQLVRLRGHLTSRYDPRPTTPENPWYGVEHLDDRRMLQALRGFLDTLLFAGVDRQAIRSAGFKEIRYRLEDAEAQVSLLRAMYPRAGFIFHGRNAEDVVASEFQQGKKAEDFRALDALYESLGRRPDSYHTRYDELVDGRVEGLFEWLGEPFDREVYDSVLAKKHSYHKATSLHRSNMPRFATVVDRTRAVCLIDTVRRASDGLGVAVVGVVSPTPASLTVAGVRPLEASVGNLSAALAKRLSNPALERSGFRLVLPAGSPNELEVSADGTVLFRLHHLDRLTAARG